MARIRDMLISLLGETAGLTRQELLATLRESNPTLSGAQLDRVIHGAGDLIIERDNRLLVARPNTVLDPDLSPPMPPAAAGRVLRIVAIDTESVVRLTSREPYTESTSSNSAPCALAGITDGCALSGFSMPTSPCRKQQRLELIGRTSEPNTSLAANPPRLFWSASVHLSQMPMFLSPTTAPPTISHFSIESLSEQGFNHSATTSGWTALPCPRRSGRCHLSIVCVNSRPDSTSTSARRFGTTR